MFMSGCVPVGDLPKAVPYIGKPFTASALLGAVDRVVGARP